MAYTQKKYVDLTGLQEFLTKLKAAYAENTFTDSAGFIVNQALRAQGDKDGNEFSVTYVKKSTADTTYVPMTRTIAGLDLTGDITKASMLSALNVADGAQVNVLEGVQVKGNGDVTFSDLTVDGNKKVQLDLSNYALKTDIDAAVASVFKFKGIVADTNALPLSGNTVGDVYHVDTDGAEYVWIIENDTGKWEKLADNSTYALASEVYTRTQIDGMFSTNNATIQDKIDAIYKAGETPTGVLANEITRATAAEDALDARLDTLEGDASTAGSVAKSIADAIGALDYSEMPAGAYVTGVTQTDGVIAVTRASKGIIEANNTGLVDGGQVYAAITTTVDGGLQELDLAEVGAAGSYIQLVSQTDGQLAASAAAFDTTVGAAGTATNNTAPTSLAVRTELDGVYASIISVSNAEIDAMFS